MPRWFHSVLLISAFINLLGAATFAPGWSYGRSVLGLLPDPHPLYLICLASFIFLFGLSFIYMAVRKMQPLLLAVSAAGKVIFGISMLYFAFSRDLSVFAGLAGATDLGLAALFIIAISGAKP